MSTVNVSLKSQGGDDDTRRAHLRNGVSAAISGTAAEAAADDSRVAAAGAQDADGV